MYFKGRQRKGIALGKELLNETEVREILEKGQHVEFMNGMKSEDEKRLKQRGGE